MVQQPIELILLRQWVSYLAVPTWIMDEEGSLVFYNEAAEPLIGRPFAEHGPMQASEIAAAFQTTTVDGAPLSAEQLPVVIALVERRPSSMSLRFRGLDGAWRRILVSALPIDGLGGRRMGALAMFWPEDGE